MYQNLKRIALLAAVAIFNANVSWAQAVSADSSVNKLLARFPAYDSAQFSANMKAIAAMGENGLTKLTLATAYPDTGRATTAQYAVNAFSRYLTEKDNSSMKPRAVTTYVRALEIIHSNDAKAFVIRQLQIIGNDEAATALKPYLADSVLCDPAARALATINSPLAKKILVDALPGSAGTNRLALIQALAYGNVREANAALVSLTHNADRMLVKASIHALARIGDVASAETLGNLAKKTAYNYETTDATQAYIDYLQSLAMNGHAIASETYAKQLMANARHAGRVHTAISALKILVDIRKDHAMSLLISAMDDPDFVYREAALKFASTFINSQTIIGWATKLKSASQAARPEIITMLGNTANPVAFAVVKNSLQDKDEKTRIAAIGAAVNTGQDKALPDLITLMKTANASTINAAKNAIIVMKGQGVVAEVAKALPDMEPGIAKAALITILGARGGGGKTKEILILASDADTTISHAASAALVSITKPADLHALFTYLESATDSVNITGAQNAIVSNALAMPDTAARTKIVVDELRLAPMKQNDRFAVILGSIGGNDALTHLSSMSTIGNPTTKLAVIDALAKSPDPLAAWSLLKICRESKGTEFFNAALNGYISRASMRSAPAEQRLLMLRNAMAIAGMGAQREMILKHVGECKTFDALLFAGKYLDEAALSHTAAESVASIASSNKNWYGSEVTAILQKAVPLLQGSDAVAKRDALSKHIAALPPGEGFISLFNGKDLSGWKGLVENPVMRMKMNADTLARKQQVANARMETGWFAKDGDLIFGGEGDNLCTTKKYGDFEMFVDWKITKDGDAGIYLRGSPQVQIWDTARRSVGADVGSGGLYNNAVNPSKPLRLADNAIGEWNNFHIIMIGDRVTVYLNGVLVVNNTILENYWDRKLPIFREEQIELQAHGTYVAYRDLYIREIPGIKPFTLNEDERKDSFRVLFDGTNMHEWTGNTTDYVIDDGAMAIYPQNGGHGNLYTKDEYSDFVYRFEFQLTPGANNGVGIRAPLEGDAAYVGMEIQILDNEAPKYADLHVYQYHGSVYGVIPAKRGFLKPTGEWNYEEIIAKGNKITVTLNGTVILDGDIAEASKDGTADKRDHSGLKRTKGHIGFLGHGDVVRFRNIRVKQL